MKKVKITENELVTLIEKLVKENLGFGPSAFGNGNGQNMGVFGTPTAKYKDLLEKEDVEEDDIDDNEDEVSEQENPDDTLNINVDDETQDGLNQEDYMESVKESRLIARLKRKLTEGKCPKSGCITKRGSKWRIISNKTGKLWDAEYDSKADAEAGLDAYHANK